MFPAPQCAPFLHDGQEWGRRDSLTSGGLVIIILPFFQGTFSSLTGLTLEKNSAMRILRKRWL
jgi:hypothetical protein